MMLNKVFPCFADDNIKVLALDNFIKEFLINEFKVKEPNIIVIPNGARQDLIQFSPTPNTINSICLGNVDGRKRQYLLKNTDIKFIGRLSNNFEDFNMRNVFGEWKREKLYSDLTHNANSILLSYSEAAPLATVESLMAGLGLVVSEACTANLDLSKPYIDVIPEDKIQDEEFVNKTIVNNREKSLSMRKEIRKYAEDNFSLTNLVDSYKAEVEYALHT